MSEFILRCLCAERDGFRIAVWCLNLSEVDTKNKVTMASCMFNEDLQKIRWEQ